MNNPDFFEKLKADIEAIPNSQLNQPHDKAYTYLKESVDEVRRVGKFVFRNNPERIDGYEVGYYKTHR